jgi:hypothetical protein
MLNTARTQIIELVAHYVGNKNNTQDLIMADKPYQFKDDFTRDTLFKYMTESFKEDVYYRFNAKNDNAFVYDVKHIIEKAFSNQKHFFEITRRLAEHLYTQTIHPKVKGGEVYFAYLKDTIIGGELCDAIGIFKSEKRETFITVDYNEKDINDINIDTNFGINIKKLDKGVIIFNTEKDTGYKAMIVDNSHKVKEAQLYWVNDFLNMTMKETPYYHTLNRINQILAYCGESITEENDFTQKDRMQIMSNSIEFMGGKELFHEKEYFTDVLSGDEKLIELYQEHKKQFDESYNNKSFDGFEIAQSVVKKNNKFAKSNIKLDHNFNIEINGGHDMIENGYDEEKKMKFYKVYYVNEG